MCIWKLEKKCPQNKNKKSFHVCVHKTVLCMVRFFLKWEYLHLTSKYELVHTVTQANEANGGENNLKGIKLSLEMNIR